MPLSEIVTLEALKFSKPLSLLVILPPETATAAPLPFSVPVLVNSPPVIVNVALEPMLISIFFPLAALLTVPPEIVTLASPKAIKLFALLVISPPETSTVAPLPFSDPELINSPPVIVNVALEPKFI